MQHSPRFLALVSAAKARITELSVDEWASGPPPGAVLVDTREDHEWQAGHALSALHIGKGVLERDAEAALPSLDQPIVLYCGGGFRSALAAAALQDMGYRRVYSLAGGWKAWLARGLPTEGGP